MENTWGPEQNTDPPGRSGGTQTAYCVLFAVSLTAGALACLFEHVTGAWIARGLYAILAGLMVIGGCGWTIAWLMSGSEDRLHRHAAAEMTEARAEARAERADIRAEVTVLSDRVAELTTQVQALTAAVAQSRVTYLPTAHQPPIGHRYLGAAAVGGVGDTVPMRTGLDPQAIQDARTIARRLVDADTLPRQDQAGD
ncbi:hypothetical protein OOJ91_13550 [Micromonospora lupini]|uniref:hypothetical protein n=1 Tax=Micromonospora lupini TaxID=285679 RepID=UPI002259B1AB|nr:hypothetical protein [Micromonospora lupini]MCX5066871.1 hypothetical protein [Micromonospora lupini]